MFNFNHRLIDNILCQQKFSNFAVPMANPCLLSISCQQKGRVGYREVVLAGGRGIWLAFVIWSNRRRVEEALPAMQLGFAWLMVLGWQQLKLQMYILLGCCGVGWNQCS